MWAGILNISMLLLCDYCSRASLKEVHSRGREENLGAYTMKPRALISRFFGFLNGRNAQTIEPTTGLQFSSLVQAPGTRFWGQGSPQWAFLANSASWQWQLISSPKEKNSWVKRVSNPGPLDPEPYVLTLRHTGSAVSCFFLSLPLSPPYIWNNGFRLGKTGPINKYSATTKAPAKFQWRESHSDYKIQRPDVSVERTKTIDNLITNVSRYIRFIISWAYTWDCKTDKDKW